MLRKNTQCSRAFTLIEVVMAMLIASVVLVTFMAAIVFAVRSSAANKDHFQALQVANYYAGLMSAANFGKLGHYDLDADDFESIFMHDEDDPLVVTADSENPNTSLKVNIWFSFSGWGTVASSTVNSLTGDLPAGTASWVSNEWAGDYVTVVEPTGLSYVLRVTSNSSSTLNFSTDLTGVKQEDLAQPLKKDSTFIINNGKRARTIVTWGNGEGYRRFEREMVIRRLTQKEAM